jgi:hypothetical protein
MPHQTDAEGAALRAEAVKTLNYQELRRMVEAAASYREKKVYIVVDDKGWSVETKEPTNTDGKAVIPCMSPGRPTARPPVALAQIGTVADNPEKPPVNLLKLKLPGSDREEPADAVFWTPAAVEKFVVPYYASVYGDQAPKKLSDIINVLGAVRDPAARGAARSETGDAFAVAHMPKSEYVQVDEPFAVLAADAEGNVSVMSVSDYVKVPG